jgi:hypothetical protein
VLRLEETVSVVPSDLVTVVVDVLVELCVSDLAVQEASKTTAVPKRINCFMDFWFPQR